MFRLTRYWIVDVLLYIVVAVIVVYVLRRLFGAVGKKGYLIPDDANKRTVGEKQSMGETITRKCLETTFNRPFHSVRPEWLKNPKTGKCLEIDCFNEELKLCVEYDGEQHYKWVPRFHKQFHEFKAQQVRDAWKEGKCKELGYTFIRVPYYVSFHKIEGYLVKELAKAKIQGMLPFKIDAIESGAGMVKSVASTLGILQG